MAEVVVTGAGRGIGHELALQPVGSWVRAAPRRSRTCSFGFARPRGCPYTILSLFLEPVASRHSVKRWLVSSLLGEIERAVVQIMTELVEGDPKLVETHSSDMLGR